MYDLVRQMIWFKIDSVDIPRDNMLNKELLWIGRINFCLKVLITLNKIYEQIGVDIFYSETNR